MATQTIRCTYCDFTTKCLSIDEEGKEVKGLDALKEHTKTKHPKVVQDELLDNIKQMQEAYRESKVKISLEEICAQCDYKEPSDGGWCYMFKEKPIDGCFKFKAMEGR